jgi:hydroxyethylthiazole kinase-like uncharacterized protein yjeF
VPSPAEILTPALLRGWPLPASGSSKDQRGHVLVVGGARATPGGAALAGLAALRVGAGRLTVAVAESVAVPLAVATPEAGVLGLPESPSGSVTGEGVDLIERELERAHAVLVGPGLDEPDGTRTLLRAIASRLPEGVTVVLDAFALGVLPDLADELDLAGRLVLTPNLTEAARLLGESEVGEDDLDRVVPELARRYGAVVTCHNLIAEPGGRQWRNAAGHPGLGTSGSGDVLAGALTGLVARGAPDDQATCWATHVHAASGDRLAARVGPLGFLARELLEQLPSVIVELST